MEKCSLLSRCPLYINLHISTVQTVYSYTTTAPQYLNPGTRQLNAFLPGPHAKPKYNWAGGCAALRHCLDAL